MTNTKRSLLLSVVSMFLCVVMLASTTFAWFTDSVESKGNIIKTGTLEVTMEWADGTKAVPADNSSDWTNAASGAIFSWDKWEPGYTEVRHIKIANEGDLALKYQISIVPTGTVSKLADVIDVYYADPAVQVANRSALTSANRLSTLTEAIAGMGNTAAGNLAAGEKHTITIALKMQESAGNDYQNKAIGSDFKIRLLATQLTRENDSFDNQYDKDSDKTIVSSDADFAAALAQDSGAPLMLANDLYFGGDMAYDTAINLAGYVLESNGIESNADLEMSNGTVSMNSTGGYLDLRPTEDSVYTFTNVDFVNNYKRKANSNTGSDRIEYIAKLYPMAKDIKTTFVFDNCTFENASVYFGASSDKPADVDVTFKNCTFNAIMGSDALIEFSSNVTGTVNIEGCTFNIEGTYANNAVIDIKTWSSTTLNVTATNNTLNANKAIPYTYDPEKGETEADSIKIGNVSSVRNYCLFDCLTGKYSTIVETGTTLNGDIAIPSK